MVSEGEDIGRVLFTADATDRDEGTNSQISYYLEEGNGKSWQLEELCAIVLFYAIQETLL